jgi:FixJ family two-component response regulator
VIRHETSTLRVLLVDNDASVRRALTRTMQHAGFDVQSFASAEALLTSDADQTDACLVLDVDMPGVGGAELRRALIESGRDRPTIFITASEREGLAAKLAALAPVAVLYKPFGNEDLLEALSRACAGDSA